jgi:hypothetical protein
MKIQVLLLLEIPSNSTVQAKAHTFDYSQVDSLAAFTGTHPQVMQARIARMNWLFDFDIQEKKLSLKHRLKLWFE